MLKHEIQDICKKYDLRPSKSKGQNFLIDELVVEKIIELANLSKEDKVLEIGPGLGVLTEHLVETAGEVYAVEVDKQAIKYLQDRFPAEISDGKLKLVENDALNVNYRELGFSDFNFNIVSNLPYSITSIFFRNFLEHGPKPKEIIVMIQYEVAKRLVAKKGEMNLLALSAQLYSKPEILFKVPSNCFWPEPEIDSAVVKLVLNQVLPDANIKNMFRLAKIGFSSKRKQLHNNLAGALKIDSDDVKKIFTDLGWRQDIRAQDLGVEDWIKLAEILRN